MLISRRLMFIHYPRTGGASVQHYLRQAVPDTYYPIEDVSLSDPQKAWLMHQGIETAILMRGFFPQSSVRGLDPRYQCQANRCGKHS